MTTMIMMRPTVGTLTGRVWEVADEITHEQGRLAKRSEVMERIVSEGGNANTASTQYSYWKKAHLAHFKTGKRTPAGPAVLQLGANGQITLPLDVLRALDVGPGEGFAARVVDGELRLIPARLVLSRAQALVKQFDTGTGSPVDELIAERREEGRG